MKFFYYVDSIVALAFYFGFRYISHRVNLEFPSADLVVTRKIILT